jgi:hypothetical protein
MLSNACLTSSAIPLKPQTHLNKMEAGDGDIPSFASVWFSLGSNNFQCVPCEHLLRCIKAWDMQFCVKNMVIQNRKTLWDMYVRFGFMIVGTLI